MCEVRQGIFQNGEWVQAVSSWLTSHPCGCHIIRFWYFDPSDQGVWEERQELQRNDWNSNKVFPGNLFELQYLITELINLHFHIETGPGSSGQTRSSLAPQYQEFDICPYRTLFIEARFLGPRVLRTVVFLHNEMDCHHVIPIDICSHLRAYIRGCLPESQLPSFHPDILFWESRHQRVHPADLVGILDFGFHRHRAVWMQKGN